MNEHNKNIMMTTCEKRFTLTLDEVTQVFDVTNETIITIIDEGIVEPVGETSDQWVFDDEAIRTIRVAVRLNNDLGINVAGAALAIELMQEIEALRAMLGKK